MKAKFTADTHPKKVNLTAGAYRTGEGKPWILPIVH
jgi:aspartate aminotransferase